MNKHGTERIVVNLVIKYNRCSFGDRMEEHVIEKMRELRKRGKSIRKICEECNIKSSSTVYGYVKDITSTVGAKTTIQTIPSIPSSLPSTPYLTLQVSGDIAANSFQMFENGESPIEVVSKLKITPEQAEHLFDKYMDLKGLQEKYDDLLIEIEGLENEKKELIFCVNEAVERFNSVAKILKEGRYYWVKIVSDDLNVWAIVPVS